MRASKVTDRRLARTCSFDAQPAQAATHRCVERRLAPSCSRKPRRPVSAARAVGDEEKSLQNPCADAIYAPSPDDGVAGIEASKTFAEAATFASFLLDLASSSFTALVDMPELADFADWPMARLRFQRHASLCSHAACVHASTFVRVGARDAGRERRATVT